jgi:FSR family fosmidomycin resistance protein-like MFS transporter
LLLTIGALDTATRMGYLLFLPLLLHTRGATVAVVGLGLATVPDLAPKGNIGQGFALFYTGVIGAGGLAPIAYGAIADHSNRTLAAAATAAILVPLVLALRPALENHRE